MRNSAASESCPLRCSAPLRCEALLESAAREMLSFAGKNRGQGGGRWGWIGARACVCVGGGGRCLRGAGR